ncbi:Membrane-associated progesterone receptor component 2 [Nymphon striatum]|nr:Membrane-associated progesterone receptor component 2 [Nymphon striatum]
MEGIWNSLPEFAKELLGSPVNICLLLVIIYLIYKFVWKTEEPEIVIPVTPQIPALEKKDMTLAELKAYDGLDTEGRVCVAVNAKVFDVTRNGRRFYGPGGPYSMFAGRDASRSLATFSVENVKEDYDDLSDLNTEQMNGIREWEQQFTEKYDYVGRLLKPGEEPTEYSDDEDGPSQNDTASESMKSESSPDKSKDD